MITIKRLDSSDRVACTRWEAFVLASPDATFFHRAGWQEVIFRAFRHRT